jgi:hypothetical protein
MLSARRRGLFAACIKVRKAVLTDCSSGKYSAGCPYVGLAILSARCLNRFGRHRATLTSPKHRESSQQIRNYSCRHTPLHKHRSRRRSPTTPRNPASCGNALRHYCDPALPIACFGFVVDLSKTLGPTAADRLHGDFLSLWLLQSLSASRLGSCLSTTFRPSEHSLCGYRLPVVPDRSPRSFTWPLFSP